MLIIKEALANTLMITTFVIIMMILVDYFNVLSHGRLSFLIRGKGMRQYMVSASLGAAPGCLGAFMNVSFYIHGLISFGALVGGMIATCGDEAFVMLALFPRQALFMLILLFMIGIFVGIIVDKMGISARMISTAEQDVFELHQEESVSFMNLREIAGHLKNISLSRFSLILALAMTLYALLSGTIGESEWGWERFTFLILIGVALFIIGSVPEHYLEEHIWNHVIKKHLLRIVLWTFAALLLVHIGLTQWEIKHFVQQHMLWVFFLACLVGLIPISGPHLIFVMLFSKGLVPFSVLLASSIVQNGHGVLPLLSFSVRDSLWVKAISLLVGLLIGGLLYSLGF
ncbi:MAG: putative manganese transporter [Chlamydiota bacterium]|nr:putative manganese transporter [Chlamydiota bacterium]